VDNVEGREGLDPLDESL
jgi:hypothetical protein